MSQEQEKKKMFEGGATELKRVLPCSSLVFYGFAFMVPIGFFTTYGLATTLTHGMVAMAYVLVTVAMGLTAWSYSRMTKEFPMAGSVYTYAQKAINPYVGFISGWIILIGYIFVPMLNFYTSAIFLVQAIPEIPMWVWITLFILLAAVVNHFGIQVTDKVNRSVCYFQILFLIIFTVITFRYIMNGGGAGTLLSPEALLNIPELQAAGGFPVLISAASIVALAFLGYDAIATLSEEAIDPKKNVGKAILISAFGAGILFIVYTYILQIGWPEAWFQIQDPEGASYEVVTKMAGSFLAYFFVAAYSTGCVAAGISSVASASRVLFNMGRDEILPKKVFSYLHPKHQTPTFSIVMICLFAFCGLFMSMEVGACLLNFGALLAFTIVNISVIAYFFIRQKKRTLKGAISYLIIPGLGAICTFVLFIHLNATSMMLGGAWVVIGLIYLAASTKFFKELPKELNV